eukprot:7612561-Lingulodinium_polyedra.AAC.1
MFSFQWLLAAERQKQFHVWNATLLSSSSAPAKRKVPSTAKSTSSSSSSKAPKKLSVADAESDLAELFGAW